MRSIQRDTSAFRTLIALGALASSLVATTGRADDAPPTGAAPADEKKVVEQQKAGDAPTIARPTDGTNVSLSAGGLWASGNSKLLAGTVNGIFEKRWGDNGLGFSLLGNYGETAAPGASERHMSVENFQGRVRYDRYLAEQWALFLIETGRHDRPQGIQYRNNIDPGVKFLALTEPLDKLWLEAGYDFQYDIRDNDARNIVGKDTAGNPVFLGLLDKTHADHSSRLFVGYKHAFNKQVNLATGLEYLQSFVDSTNWRVNFDAVFAAALGGGLSLGLGVTARYDHNPLPGKENLDTATTVSLIYAFSDVPEPPKPKTCPCPPEPPPPTNPPPPPG